MKTYKEIWIEKYPDRDFETSGCRDNEFKINQDILCGDERCKDCWNEEIPENDGGNNV